MPLPYWEVLWEAVHVATREQAQATLELMIQHCQQEVPSMTYEEAKRIQLANIGWFFGELNRGQQEHAMEMWPEAEHPIFGRQLDPTEESILSAGMVVARYMNEGHTTAEAIAAGRKVVEEKNAH